MLFYNLEEAIAKYDDKFPDDTFPSWMMIPMYQPEVKLFEIINQCINQGKTVYELGYLEETDEDLKY